MTVCTVRQVLVTTRLRGSITFTARERPRVTAVNAILPRDRRVVISLLPNKHSDKYTG